MHDPMCRDRTCVQIPARTDLTPAGQRRGCEVAVKMSGGVEVLPSLIIGNSKVSWENCYKPDTILGKEYRVRKQHHQNRAGGDS